MKLAKFARAVVVVCAVVVVSLAVVRQAAAIDFFWTGAVSDDWETLIEENWTVTGIASPRASAGERAVIGSDDSDTGGVLNSDDAPFGSPVVDTDLTVLPVGSPGGIALGSREFDYDEYALGNLVYVNEEPAPGELIGRLTIASGGKLESVASALGGPSGADGRILVGVEGRGYLEMTGGELRGPSLTVAGEQNNSGEGVSHVYLSNDALLHVDDGVNGLATFGRALTVTGPSVDFEASGTIRLQSSNTYYAEITSPTDHSALKSDANVFLGGDLVVDYSGGGSPAIGDSWNLFDYAGGTLGNFSNVGADGGVEITGVPTPQAGEVYRLRKTTGGFKGNLIQLLHDAVLVLEVDRTTGDMKIINPFEGAMSIDGYQIRSANAGSLVPSYDGIADNPTPQFTDWEKQTGSEFVLGEFKVDGSDAPGTTDVLLGTGYDREAVADNLDIGNNGEDLVFTYNVALTPGSQQDVQLVRGHVVYTGTPFENNIVLRVDPDTGEARIKNESLIDLSFDAYEILCESGECALDDAGWTGVGGNFSQQAGTATNLTELDPYEGDYLTIPAGMEVAIGDISLSNFTTEAEQDGLSMNWIRTAIPGGAAVGDYNDDGVVDAADYTVWRDAQENGESTLLNRDPANTGLVTEDDYTSWRENFGATGGDADEEEFRTAVVRFEDLGAGAGAGAATVPEPSSAFLALMGLGGALLFGRKGSHKVSRRPIGPAVDRGASRQLGVNVMSRRFGLCLSTLIGLCAIVLSAQPATAATQAIMLSNHNFELPGEEDRPPDNKVFAYDSEGNEIVGAIPGWTFPGPGLEEFGHEFDEGPPITGRKGDSGVEGGGNPSQEMILALPDGVAYQTATGFTLEAIPSTQQYIFSFDAHEIFATDENDAGLSDVTQLTARFYYGAARTTLDTFVINPPPDPNPEEVVGLTGDFVRWEYIIPYDSPLLTGPAIGETIGVEFDVTSDQLAEPPARSWAGIDNVIMEIAGVLDGDLNGDGFVDLGDFAIVRDNQRAEGYLALADGDMNRDGIVNLNDFRAWKNLASIPPPGAGGGSAAGAGGGVPEPSTLVLAMIMAAVLGGASLRRKSAVLTRLFVMAAFGVGMVFATASPSAAAVLAYDPFLLPDSDGDPLTDPAEAGLGEYNFYDYVEELPNPPPYPDDPPHVALKGQNPMIGPTPGSGPSFWAGPWQGPTATATAIQQPGLSYIGAPALGGSATVFPIPDPGFDETMDISEANPRYEQFDGRVGRVFATPWNDSTPDATTYYMSFLANFGTTEAGMGYRTVEFWSTGVDVTAANPDPFRVMEIGYSEYGNYNSATNPGSLQQNPATARLAIRTDFPDQEVTLLESETAAANFNEDGLTHLIVLKFELNAAAESDTVTAYLDPPSIVEPELASALQVEKDIDIAAMSTISRFGGLDLRMANPTDDPELVNVPFSNTAFDELRIGTTFLDVMPPLPYPGDTDGDDDADLDDLDTIRSFWGQTVSGGPSEGDVATANGRQGADNFVGLADFALWKSWRNVFGSGSGAAVVPEPSSLLLALLAAIALVGTRTRRVK